MGIRSFFDRSVIGFLVLVISAFNPVCAETFRVALYGDVNDGPFSYQYDVLRLAIEHSEGDHQLIFEDFGDASVSRILDLMERGNIDVMFAGYTPDREQRFAQIYVPLTRGILGYRVFVARPESAEVLAGINTVEELRTHCIGSGADWLDSDILERNGFCVEKSSYENLWPMLSHGRFDLLNRGLHEVHGELDLIDKAGLMLDERMLLVYPMDFFFYVRAGDQNRQDILTTGLLNAYENGAFMKNFDTNKGIARSLSAIKDPNRKVFFVGNPFLSDRVRAIPDHFWEK